MRLQCDTAVDKGLFDFWAVYNSSKNTYLSSSVNFQAHSKAQFTNGETEAQRLAHGHRAGQWQSQE